MNQMQAKNLAESVVFNLHWHSPPTAAEAEPEAGPDDGHCAACDGTGDGMADGSTCSVCRGLGGFGPDWRRV